MEESPDTQDLSFDADRMAAMEQQLAAMSRDVKALEQTVADQQEEVLAARELGVEVARLELEIAQQALTIERLRARLRARGHDDAGDRPVQLVTSLRPAAAPRGAAVPELRWTAEVIVAE